MSFSIHLALKRIRYNLRQYLFVMMQIALGVGLLYISLCVDMSLRNQMAAYSQSVADQVITISGTFVSGSELVITEDDFVAILQMDDQLVNALTYTIETGLYIEADGKQKRIQVLFVSDSFYEMLMHRPDIQSNGYYAGHEVYQHLSNDSVFVLNNNNVFSENTRELYGIPLTDFQPLIDIGISQMARNYLVQSYSGEDYSFANTLFLPLTAYEQNKPSKGGVPYLYMSIDTENINKTDAMIQRIVAYLQTEHPDYAYQCVNDLQEILMRTVGMMRNASLIRVVAICLLVIVTFGFLGLFMLIAKRRIRSFGIARMCGARNRQIVIELFLEICVLTLCGTFIGIMASSIAFMILQTTLYVIKHNVVALFICFAFALCITIVVSIAATHMTRRTTSINILAEQ